MVINKSWIGEISLNRSLFFKTSFDIASVVDIQTLPQEEVDRYTSLLLRDLREVVQNLDHLMGGGTYIIQNSLRVNVASVYTPTIIYITLYKLFI